VCIRVLFGSSGSNSDRTVVPKYFLIYSFLPQTTNGSCETAGDESVSPAQALCASISVPELSLFQMGHRLTQRNTDFFFISLSVPICVHPCPISWPDHHLVKHQPQEGILQVVRLRLPIAAKIGQEVPHQFNIILLMGHRLTQRNTDFFFISLSVPICVHPCPISCVTVLPNTFPAGLLSSLDRSLIRFSFS